MQNKIIKPKIFMGLFLMLMLLTIPQLSYADWAVGVNFGAPAYHPYGHIYRWHDYPRWGLHFRFLPAGYHTVWVGGARYYYCNGLYYSYVSGDYVLVNPPTGAYVNVIPPDFRPVVINGVTYYTDHGVYYVAGNNGYTVVAEPQPVVFHTSRVWVRGYYGPYGGWHPGYWATVN